MKRHAAAPIVFCALLCLTPALVQGQLTCARPANCAATARSSNEHIVVRVQETVNGKLQSGGNREVRFTASNGKLADATVKTDTAGYAVNPWTGDASNSEVSILATAVVNGKPETVTITLGGPYRLAILAPSSGEREWYQERQLKDPVEVAIQNASLLDCPHLAVAFRASTDGALAPDTVPGEWRALAGGLASGCVASTRWRLGKTVGVQTLRYSLVNDAREAGVVQAKSRAIPWVGIGLAATRLPEYYRLNEKTAKIHVVHKGLAPNGIDSVEVSYDSTASSRGLQKVSHDYAFAPVVGVNWPLMLKWRDVRAFVGADMQQPTRSWFAGASLSQAAAGWLHEDVPIDVQFVAHFARRDEVTNPGACANDAKTCEVAPHVAMGYGFIVATNAATALEKIYTALLPK